MVGQWLECNSVQNLCSGIESTHRLSLIDLHFDNICWPETKFLNLL